MGRRRSRPCPAAEAELVTLIGRIQAEHRDAYGVPRITAELHRRGIVVNHKWVERLMRDHGPAGITLRKHRPLTRPAAGPVTPVGDLIRRDFTVEKLGDPVGRGHAYHSQASAA